MDNQASESSSDWAIKISTFLIVAPWLEKALDNKGWEFFVTGACWALAAALFVWAFEIKASSNFAMRPLLAFLIVAAFAAGGSALFDRVGKGLGFDADDRHRSDVVFSVLGTFVTVWTCWKLTQHRDQTASRKDTTAGGSAES